MKPESKRLMFLGLSVVILGFLTGAFTGLSGCLVLFGKAS